MATKWAEEGKIPIYYHKLQSLVYFLSEFADADVLVALVLGEIDDLEDILANAKVEEYEKRCVEEIFEEEL